MKKILIASTFLMGMLLTGCGGDSNNAEIDKLRAELDSLKALQLNSQNTQAESYVAEETATVEVEETTPAEPASTVSYDDNLSTPSTSTSSSKPAYAGTYKFTDGKNIKWTLKLNADKTATISSNNGNSMAYGSWYINGFNNLPVISFSDEVPLIWFPAGEERGTDLEIRDGYIYKGRSAQEAKNPRLRLPLSK